RRVRRRHRVGKDREAHLGRWKPLGDCGEASIMTSAALAALFAWSLWPSTSDPRHAPIEQSHAVTDARVISGVVHDASGSVIAGASVVVRAPSGVERPAVSGADGTFSVTVHSSEDMLLIVRAPGFS